MQIGQALQLALLLLREIQSAIFKGQTTITLEGLGAEHRQALADLQAYLAATEPPSAE
jgi:hypothetical protein